MASADLLLVKDKVQRYAKQFFSARHTKENHMKRMKIIFFSTVLSVVLITPSHQAVAKDCGTLSDAVSAAEGAVTGLMASVSSANAAVSAAKAKVNSSRLPAQRVSAQVNLMREQKSASQAKSALSTAKNVLRSARAALSQCK